MASVLSCYSAFITQVFEVEATLRRGGSVNSLDVYAKLNAMFYAAIDAAKRVSKPEEERQASFAVVAWADEALIQAPGSDWGTRIPPLQKEHFNTLGGGDEFFRELKNLRADAAGVAEVYFAMLSLGFKGRYMTDPNGPAELRNQRDQLWRQLPTQPPRLGALATEHAYPQPYREADPQHKPPPINWRPILWGAAAALALLLIGTAVFLYVTGPRSPAQIEADAREMARKYLCADLTIAVDPDRNLRVTGHLASTADAASFAAELKTIKGALVAMQTAVHIRPLCEVLEILKLPLQATDAAKAPTVGVRAGSTKIGKKVVFDVRAADFDGHVYIDMYDPEGNVLHVLPNQDNKATYRSVRNRFSLGEDKAGNRVFDLEEPPGEYLVTILQTNSTTPLFAAGRPETEKAADYLPALREALKAKNEGLAVGRPLFFDATR